MEPRLQTLGEIAYEAYRAHTHGKSAITGLAIPPWGSLTEDIQAAWRAAAIAVRYEIALKPGDYL